MPKLDVVPIKYRSKKPYTVVVPDQSLWLNGKVGAVVYGPESEIYKALGSYSSIFQAEIRAFKGCVLEVAKS